MFPEFYLVSFPALDTFEIFPAAVLVTFEVFAIYVLVFLFAIYVLVFLFIVGFAAAFIFWLAALILWLFD